MQEYIKMFCEKNIDTVEVSYEVCENIVDNNNKTSLGRIACLKECRDCPGSMAEKREYIALSDFQSKYPLR